MDSKEKASELVTDSAEKVDTSKLKKQAKGKWMEHARAFFTKEKQEFDGLTQVRQASFVVAALLFLSLLSGMVGMLIVSFVAIAFLMLGVQGKGFATKIMPHLPKIFLGALVLVILFWIVSFFLWMAA